tara:strand:+ start:169 stop:1140 length:972 start_codon:yes stop_codon:yes gene_type:complete
MKQLIVLSIFVLSLVSCNSTSLNEDLIYEVNASSFTIEKFGFDNDDLITKTLKFYFKLNEKENKNDVFQDPLVQVVIESDGKYYSFNGESSYLKQTDYNEEQYTFTLKGYNNSFFIIELKTLNNSFSGYENSLISSLKGNYNESELSFYNFNQLYKKGAENEFFPLNMKGLNTFDEVPDYWLSYFNKDDILSKRIQQRKELEEKNRLKNEKLNQQKIAREKIQKRKSELCQLMKKYDYGKMKDSFKKGCGSGGYYPKSQTSVGYMDVEGILSGYFNGEPYTGPFTLFSDGRIKSGIGKNRGCDLNFTSKAARKAVKNYLVRCK